MVGTKGEDYMSSNARIAGPWILRGDGFFFCAVLIYGELVLMKLLSGKFVCG